jgi:hypothetical protein
MEQGATLQSFTSGGYGVIAINHDGGNTLTSTAFGLRGYKLDVNGTGRF